MHEIVFIFYAVTFFALVTKCEYTVARYPMAGSNNVSRYTRIAAAIPNKTIRDVAFRIKYLKVWDLAHTLRTLWNPFVLRRVQANRMQHLAHPQPPMLKIQAIKGSV